MRDQDLVWVASRRGKVIARASITERTNKGAGYMTFQWWIGACNELTIHRVDPDSKTPEYKFAAVRIEPIADHIWAESYVRDTYSKLRHDLATAAIPMPATPPAPSKTLEPA